MRTVAILEIEVAPDRLPRIWDAGVGAQVDLLAIDALLSALDGLLQPAYAAAFARADETSVSGPRSSDKQR